MRTLTKSTLHRDVELHKADMPGFIPRSTTHATYIHPCLLPSRLHGATRGRRDASRKGSILFVPSGKDSPKYDESP
jgi:hypothetical protein